MLLLVRKERTKGHDIQKELKIKIREKLNEKVLPGTRGTEEFPIVVGTGI